MSLESAALAVGKALGKRLAHAWLTERSDAEERGKDLVELTRARLPDRIMRRRFERQIADIADQVAARLLTLCGHEYGGLRRNDKAAALAEVARTLAEADLSDRALFDVDVDARRLAARVRAGFPDRQVELQLGVAGARLYSVVLDECCDCLVRIVRQLPQFGPRASAETLARLSGVSDQVSLVLARLPIRTLDAPDGESTDEDFRRRYLEHISVNLDVLELFGVRIERYRPRTTLSVAYISLSVSTDGAEALGRRRSPAAGRGLHLDEWRKEETAPQEATLRVETALGRAPLTLIRGEAGSGKSTLLRWLAISAARGAFTTDLADWNGSVPFLIKLRSHTTGALPPPERFLEGVADPIAGLMPKGWVHRQLRNGRALLLVDGVDELPSAQRRSVRPWLNALRTEYPGLRAIVTSRPAAAGSDWLAAEGFTTAFLERMTPTDIKELIRHWHDAVRDAGDLPCAPEQLPGFEAALLARLESAPHLRALAGSPLLAAMLCALNLDREKQLPRDRMGLYAAALELLLERRDIERQIEADLDVPLERPQKLQILQDLAWRLSITGRTELPTDAALRRIADKLAAMPNAPVNADAVLDNLLQRSGVLREPVPGRIDFVHRTVQEYLTAKQFADDGDLEPLIERAHKDQWRETIIMAAGHANAPQRAELLTGLLGRIAAEPRHARRLKLLLAGCLETLQVLPLELRQDVEACVDDLIPPRDLASARSLSNVGEQILDRLPRTPDRLTPAAARAVIRTAWLVNGPKALDLLTGYSTDPRDIVQEELVKAWEYFDPDLYARQVLAHAPLPDGHLDIPAPRLLPASKHIETLRSLDTQRFPISDLAFLHELRRPLRRLNLSYLCSGDLSPLTSCAETLQDLFIAVHTVVRDFSPLRALCKLRKFGFIADDIRDLEFVRELPQLELLYLYDLQLVTDLSPLQSQASSLRQLVLNKCSTLTDLGELPPLNEVTLLSIAESPLASGLRELVERAPKLRNLYVNNSSWVDDLGCLTALNLEQLGLGGCREITNFEPLALMTGLNQLDLEDTNIGDLTPLRELTRLETLFLGRCANVTDLAPLENLRNLRHVYLERIGNDIDLAPLANHRQLTVSLDRDQRVRNRKMLKGRVQFD